MVSEYKFDLTPIAIEKAYEKLKDRSSEDSYIRVGVRGGKCSGFSYVIEFYDGLPKNKDIVFIFDKVKILIDVKSIIYLNGTILDWESDVMKHGFVFKNPNIKSECGCKESFSV
jgi:iron-sulfur cluster assembly protein